MHLGRVIGHGIDNVGIFGSRTRTDVQTSFVVQQIRNLGLYASVVVPPGFTPAAALRRPGSASGVGTLPAAACRSARSCAGLLGRAPSVR
jgi:hypothetical protein